MQALVVITQRELSEQLANALRQIDVEAIYAADIPSALKECELRSPALLITSWGLDALDGLALCREVRKTHSQHHPLVLMISDRSATIDLQTMLDAGVDDYILYPIESDRLRIRLRIALQRARNRVSAEDVQRRCAKSTNALSWPCAVPTKGCGTRNRMGSLGISLTRSFGFRRASSNSWVTPTKNFLIL